VDGGWPCGRIVNPIGDSDTGKTVLAMTAMAEAAKSPDFEQHDLIYADIEEAITFDISAMFGKRLASRLVLLTTRNDDEDLLPPETIEQLHYQLLDRIDSKKPFVYVVDSLDFLPSRDELDKTEEQRAAWKKGKDTTGTFAMSKQKYIYKMLRELKGKISGTDSLLIVISHAHDKIGSFFPEKTRSGGKALLFASSYDHFLSVADSDKVRKRIIGRKIRSKSTKNRITGKKRTIDFWVYDSIGIDDIKSSIDFLLAEGFWEKSGGWIIAKDMYGDQKFHHETLISAIESGGPADRSLLYSTLQKAWDDIEDSLRISRSQRYE
jgi:RecA/RadA recombinase